MRLPGLRAPFAVEYHDDKRHGFAQDEDDDAWLAKVSAKNWIVISHDKRFHVDSLAMEAVRQHGGRVFYLDGGSSVKWDKLRRFCAAFRRINEIIKIERKPFIYRVRYDDKVIPVRRF